MSICSKTGDAGLMAEGKQRFTEYKQDKADGSVNWAQEGKDAMKDWKPQVCIGFPALGLSCCSCLDAGVLMSDVWPMFAGRHSTCSTPVIPDGNSEPDVCHYFVNNVYQ